MANLRILLLLNAASCLGFGLLFSLGAGPVATFLGAFPATYLWLLGLGLILNGMLLVWTASRAAPPAFAVLFFSLGDLFWVLMSVALWAGGWGVTHGPAQAAMLIVALGVLCLGIGQVVAYRQAQPIASGAGHLAAELSLLARAYRSWTAIKGWVMAWLVLLNGVFLVAPAFVAPDIARIILAGWAMSGPFLAVQIIWQGGLTRALGLAHLVPWTPLLIWLLWHQGWALSADYLGVLSLGIAICLAFDLYDLWRWIYGERYVLGSVEATRAGASKAAIP